VDKNLVCSAKLARAKPKNQDTHVPGSLQRSSSNTNIPMVDKNLVCSAKLARAKPKNSDTLVPGSLQKSSRNTMSPCSSKPTSFRAHNSNRFGALPSLLVVCLMSIQMVHGASKTWKCPVRVGDEVLSRESGSRLVVTKVPSVPGGQLELRRGNHDFKSRIKKTLGEVFFIHQRVKTTQPLTLQKEGSRLFGSRTFESGSSGDIVDIASRKKKGRVLVKFDNDADSRWVEEKDFPSLTDEKPAAQHSTKKGALKITVGTTVRILPGHMYSGRQGTVVEHLEETSCGKVTLPRGYLIKLDDPDSPDGKTTVRTRAAERFLKVLWISYPINGEKGPWKNPFAKQ